MKRVLALGVIIALTSCGGETTEEKIRQPEKKEKALAKMKEVKEELRTALETDEQEEQNNDVYEINFASITGVAIGDIEVMKEDVALYRISGSDIQRALSVIPLEGTKDDFWSPTLASNEELINQSDELYCTPRMKYEACKKHFKNIQGDWRLPTIKELELIYINRKDLGKFYELPYWSSTYDYDGYSMKYIDFLDGKDMSISQGSPCHLRLVRTVNQ